MSWSEIEHFKPEEFDAKDIPGSGREKMSLSFVMALDKYHRLLSQHLGYDIAIVIHQNGGYATGGHSSNSAHYKGKAADFHAVNKQTGLIIDWMDLWIVAEKCALFNGIGLYPGWHSPGLHVDRGAPYRRWMRSDGLYLPLTAENLKGVIV